MYHDELAGRDTYSTAILIAADDLFKLVAILTIAGPGSADSPRKSMFEAAWRARRIIASGESHQGRGRLPKGIMQPAKNERNVTVSDRLELVSVSCLIATALSRISAPRVAFMLSSGSPLLRSDCCCALKKELRYLRGRGGTCPKVQSSIDKMSF